MDGGKGTGLWEAARKGLGADEEKLDRALMAGLMLEVILETANSPVDPPARRHLVKTRMKDTLVRHLAGKVTLDHFRHLLRKLDHWFPVYYPLITAGAPAAPHPAATRTQANLGPDAPAPPLRRAVREDRLGSWIKVAGANLLPRRPHRKLRPDKLREFLSQTQGSWFRLKDFEQYFGVDRKTAWEYLQKLLHAELLRHNQARSAAVRYALASRFLLVRADDLGPKVREMLSDLPETLAVQISEWLTATGGEAFWEEEWHGRLDPPSLRHAMNRLQASDILEVVCQVGGSHMVRLLPCWLQS